MNNKLFTFSYLTELTGGILLALLLCNSAFALPTNTLRQQNNPLEQTEISDLLSVDIKDIDLKEALKFISDHFKIEFVDSEKLPQIFITVKVSDAPWQEILAAVLQAHSISYQLIDNKCYFFVNKDVNPDKLSSLSLTNKQKSWFGDPDFKGEDVSIDVKDVELNEVLRFLSDNYEFNFVLNQELKGKKVTVKTDDIPWGKMLSSLLKEHNLKYNRIGKVLYIFPA